MVALLLVSVISTFGDKLEQFVADVVGDEGRGDGHNGSAADLTPFGAPQSMGMGRPPVPLAVPPRMVSLGTVGSGSPRPLPHGAKAD